MPEFRRLKNRFIAKVLNVFPSLTKSVTESYEPRESAGVPWTSLRTRLNAGRVAVVTTAGVHHRSQRPFDMKDPDGDPTFRVIDIRKPLTDLIITHDYYDHADADRDINIVFPVQRLKEFEAEAIIGSLADIHYGFMGHIKGPHIHTLTTLTAPEVAGTLKADSVDLVLLTPG